MTDEQKTDAALVAEIVADPADPLPCNVLADRLDERGQVTLAYAYRWMARTGRRPATFRFHGSNHRRWIWLRDRRGSVVPMPLGGRDFAAARRRARVDRLIVEDDFVTFRVFAEAVDWLAFRLDTLRIIFEGPQK